MRFELGDEASALRDAAQALLSAQATPAVIRAGWPDGDRKLVQSVWEQFGEGGLIGLLVPEAADGLGLDEDSVGALFEELGRSGLPVPAAETIAVAAPLLAGHSALADVLAGTTLVTAKLGGGELVPFGQHADLVLLEHDNGIWLHERGELELTPVESVDGSRGLARLGAVSGGQLLTDDPIAVAAAWQRGVLGTSALLVGLGQRMLDMTVAYVSQREQFGVPIGSFQAIKHALATALLALEFARPAVLAAGWALANDEPDAAARTSMGKVLASDAARLIARTGIQSHGAIAYTVEYDLHLYAKRVWALAPSWGSPAWHRDRLAESLGFDVENVGESS
jgi:alkylation response protein AidB-like acyl-CoA dehydrogenase